MADVFFPSFDPNAEPGEKFGPEVRAEIEEVAPSTLNNGAVTEPKLAERAVTQPKIGLGAVHSENIGTGEVKAPNLDTASVTEPKLAEGSVTPSKCGPGVLTIQDADGEILDVAGVVLTSTQYESIATPSPSLLYFIKGS